MRPTFRYRRLCRALQFLAILFLYHSTPASSQQRAVQTNGTFQIPLAYNRLTTPCPMNQVRINGTSFILDPGTSAPLVFDTRAANQLHLASAEQKEAANDTDQAVEFTNLKRVELLGKSLLNLVFHDLSVKQHTPMAS